MGAFRVYASKSNIGVELPEAQLVSLSHTIQRPFQIYIHKLNANRTDFYGLLPSKIWTGWSASSAKKMHYKFSMSHATVTVTSLNLMNYAWILNTKNTQTEKKMKQIIRISMHFSHKFIIYYSPALIPHSVVQWAMGSEHCSVLSYNNR